MSGQTDDATTETDTGAPAEVKDAFREALERKKKQKHPHEDASQNDGNVHGAHGAETKRMFRRKSGG